jgi:hypothetical protein
MFDVGEEIYYKDLKDKKKEVLEQISLNDYHDNRVKIFLAECLTNEILKIKE